MQLNKSYLSWNDVTSSIRIRDSATETSSIHIFNNLLNYRNLSFGKKKNVDCDMKGFIFQLTGYIIIFIQNIFKDFVDICLTMTQVIISAHMVSHTILVTK